MYSIDFYKFIKRFIPYFLRKPTNLALFESAVTPLIDVNDNLITLANETKFKLQFTGQVIYLEEYLNSLYDSTLKRIYIEDGNFIDYTFLYRQAELRPALFIRRQSEGYLPPYISSTDEVINSINYIIYIPSDVVFDTNVITAQINQYNPAGRVYQIQIF